MLYLIPLIPMLLTVVNSRLESLKGGLVNPLQPLALILPYGQTLKFIHDYWKNYSFDYTDLLSIK